MPSQMTPPDLIGQSQIFLDALDHASRVAMIDRPMLVIGEHGTGKDLISARIHYLSPRWEGPFVKVNCAAFSAEQLDMEIFGRNMTGGRQRGQLELAEGGTLFLDQIAAAPLMIQEKLLQFLESGEFDQAGGHAPKRADVRIVATAAEDPRLKAHEGAIRAGLLDRLAFDVVAIPALRDRQDDIPILAAHFGGLAAAEVGMKFPGFAPEAMLALKSHEWPGNVRELKNTVERATLHWCEAVAEGLVSEIVIDPFEPVFGRFNENKATKRKRAHAPINLTHPNAQSGVHDLRAYLNELEKEIVTDALAKNGGSQKHAAQALSLTYDQIRGIIKKHGISG